MVLIQSIKQILKPEKIPTIFYGMIGETPTVFMGNLSMHLLHPWLFASGGRMAQSLRDFDAGRYDLQSGGHSFFFGSVVGYPLKSIEI